jgi:hypothetical protein
MQRPGRAPAGGDERARNAWRIALAIAEQNCPSDTLILFGDEAGYSKVHLFHRILSTKIATISNTHLQYQDLLSIQHFLSRLLSINSKQLELAINTQANKKMTQCQQIANQIGFLITRIDNNKYPKILFGNMSETKQGSRIRWNQKKNFVQFPHYIIYDYLRWYGYRKEIGVFLADEAWTSKAAYFQIFPNSKNERMKSITLRSPQEWISIKRNIITELIIQGNRYLPTHQHFDTFYEKYCTYLSDFGGAFNIARKYCDVLSLNNNLKNTQVEIYLNSQIIIDSSFIVQNPQNQRIAIHPLRNQKQYVRLNLCK